MRGKIKLKL